MSRLLTNICLTAAALLINGCVTDSHPAAPNAKINAKPETATIGYWAAKPATVRVTADDYDQLWDACDAVSHKYLMAIDRTDYRNGVMTTRPLISKYFFEFWRDDVASFDDTADSSLATYRRTVRYEISKRSDHEFAADIKVIVERSSTFERRVTTAVQYRDAFAAPPPGTEYHADDGTVQPYQTWYAVGRDPQLEASIGKKLQAMLLK